MIVLDSKVQVDLYESAAEVVFVEYANAVAESSRLALSSLRQSQTLLWSYLGVMKPNVLVSFLKQPRKSEAPAR